MQSHGVPCDEAGHAAKLINQLCVERAWSAYDLAAATATVAKRRRDARFEVSRRTINRVLSQDSIPSARVKCGIALALDVAPWQIWGAGAMPLLHEQALAATA
jgi:lambda repressor-like predicted transcriptional regulator